jgi:hypothetical protein
MLDNRLFSIPQTQLSLGPPQLILKMQVADGKKPSATVFLIREFF